MSKYVPSYALLHEPQYLSRHAVAVFQHHHSAFAARQSFPLQDVYRKILQRLRKGKEFQCTQTNHLGKQVGVRNQCSHLSTKCLGGKSFKKKRMGRKAA